MAISTRGVPPNQTFNIPVIPPSFHAPTFLYNAAGFIPHPLQNSANTTFANARSWWNRIITGPFRYGGPFPGVAQPFTVNGRDNGANF